MLLALDTATSAITVALLDGTDVLAEHTVLDARAAGELTAPGIEQVLAQAGRTVADIDAVAVGTGPGPFTGLRVGIVTARVLAFARDLPVHGLSSLDAVAHEVVARGLADGEFVVATDARRKEVYWARYAADGRRLTEPAVDRPAELPADVRALPAAGRGPLLYPDAFAAALDVLDVSAAHLGLAVAERLAAGEDLADTTPLYLRRPDAVPSVSAKQVR